MSHALYHDGLVALAKSGVGAGRLTDPHATARVDNPLCGDEVTLDLHLSGDTVQHVGHRVRGCMLCEASAAWIATHAPGAARQTVMDVFAGMAHLMGHGELPKDYVGHWSGIEAFSPVHSAKSRRRCVLLPFEAIAKALTVLDRENA
jgi:nitrogen fixation protein NifU and related proteins